MERTVYRQRGVLIATDYLVNSGGVIFAAQEQLINTPEHLRLPAAMRGNRTAVEHWLVEHAEEFAALAEQRRQVAESYRETVIRNNMRELADLLIAEMPDEALYRSLAHLQAAEFLYETRLFPEQVYTFKHALTHEVAYSSLLQERRRVLHAGIVAAIEQLYTDRLTEEAERLAHHAFRNAVWEKAFTYCQQTAAKATGRSAHREAVGLYDQAIQALEQLSGQRDIRHDALVIRISLRHSLLALGDFDRMFTQLREIEALAEALGEQDKMAWVASATSTVYWLRGKYSQALAASQRALSLAVTLDDFPLRVAEHYHLSG